ncbi:ABC-type uncharacterized transport system permease subunit [Flavimobilis soli]|uniref:ABC-type uncharacterized transport system permease subunit n=1 Tax=Flavimobilis soli TaxID=442709 RepID=A0A2A9ED79_9MICO|nr:ABC-2 family transporter protein [Flavimobilis soli]PFG36888.1 ABC-type uncharacterized transport system permease subunit [Flavimobilis soli]
MNAHTALAAVEARPARPPEQAEVRGVRYLARITGALLRTEVQARAAYRAQIMIGAFGWVVPLAFMALWRGASDDGAVGGVTQAQFTTYFAIVLVTTNLSVGGEIIFGLSDRLHDGRLSAMLLRPFHPVLVPAAEGLAGNLYRLPVLVVAVPTIILAAGGETTGRPSDVALAVVVSVLGVAAASYLSAMVATVAFWMTKAQGVQGLLFGAEWVLGGMISPIALLPGALPAILAHQPLWYACGAPAEIIAGMGDHSWWLVAECAAWIVVLHLIFRQVWRRALRKHEAVGT